MRHYKVEVVTSSGPGKLKPNTTEFTGSQNHCRQQAYLYVFINQPCFVVAVRETHEEIDGYSSDELNSFAPGV